MDRGLARAADRFIDRIGATPQDAATGGTNAGARRRDAAVNGGPVRPQAAVEASDRAGAVIDALDGAA